MFLLLLCLPWLSNAQGNLQFNQVKLVGSTAETVPVGKVWKIESAPVSVKDGIQAIPRFMLGQDTILLACCDPFTVSQLENVISVKLEWKGSNSGTSNTNPPTTWTQNGASNVSIKLQGIKNPAQAFEQIIPCSNVPTGNSENYIVLGNHVPLYPNSNQITSFSLSFSIQSYAISGLPIPFIYAPCSYDFLVTFNLATGKSILFPLSTSGGSASSVGIVPISIFGPNIPTESRDRKFSTEFPIWVPAGTSVKTLSNIGKLSILEFNVTQ